MSNGAGNEVRIGPGDKTHASLGLGCWAFGGAQWGGQDDAESMETMQRAYDLGVTHFDTASGYGSGHSEELVGSFIRDKRDNIFLASKQLAAPTKEKYAKAIDASLSRLKAEYIDLYYIHWPRSNVDLRPTMEALEEARSAGKVRAIGVSNFSTQQMDQIREVGTIDANQLCYNLYWRWDERDIIPYCNQHDIAVVTYSSIAQGILTGKFPRHPEFPEGDQRPKTVLFDEKVYPHLYEATEKLKGIAERASRPLTHLAIRWVAAQPGITSILVGARNGKQIEENVRAMQGQIPQEVIDEMTRISDEAVRHIPDAGNIFRFYP